VITDLGTLGGAYAQTSAAIGINDRGQVIGWSSATTVTHFPSVSVKQYAFIWQHAAMSDLGGFGDWTEARAINDHGQLVGEGSDRHQHRS
jgi:probable HAF family extracellular repeat protein